MMYKCSHNHRKRLVDRQCTVLYIRILPQKILERTDSILSTHWTEQWSVVCGAPDYRVSGISFQLLLTTSSDIWMLCFSSARIVMNRPIKKKVPNKDEEEAIKEAFNKFDLDGDGYLDNHEMRRLLNKFGIKCTEEEVVDIIKEADYKRDGKIDFKGGWDPICYINSTLVQVVACHLITESSAAPMMALRWRHNGHDAVSNHHPRDCLLNRLFKVNIKAPRHWPLCGEFTGDRWIPRTNGQLRGKCFHLMTSSWQSLNSHIISKT